MEIDVGVRFYLYLWYAKSFNGKKTLWILQDGEFLDFFFPFDFGFW